MALAEPLTLYPAGAPRHGANPVRRRPPYAVHSPIRRIPVVAGAAGKTALSRGAACVWQLEEPPIAVTAAMERCASAGADSRRPLHSPPRLASRGLRQSHHGRTDFSLLCCWLRLVAVDRTIDVTGWALYLALIFKPHWDGGVLCLGGGRALASLSTAAITVICSGRARHLLFGVESWRDFLAAARFSRQMILDHNAVGYEKMISVFAWARLWHCRSASLMAPRRWPRSALSPRPFCSGAATAIRA